MIESIGDLKPDQRNARKHNPRNIGMIEAALREVGAARSIVIDEKGNILAGNGTIEAAAQAGIERVQVVDADGETIIAVRRSGLTEAQKRKLALYDNRSAELADWDAEILAAVKLDDDAALEGLFSDDELGDILSTLMGDPFGDVVDGNTKARNLSRMDGEGSATRVEIGEIMTCISHELYQSIWEIVSNCESQQSGISMILERGIETRDH